MPVIRGKSAHTPDRRLEPSGSLDADACHYKLTSKYMTIVLPKAQGSRGKWTSVGVFADKATDADGAATTAAQDTAASVEPVGAAAVQGEEKQCLEKEGGA